MTLSDLYALFQEHPLITTDTRDCPPDSLFFALRGTSFDGNRFAEQALAAGCAYAVVDDAEVARRDARLLFTDDVLATLQALAAHHRRTLATPVLQITGTNGKTTTKELIAAVLSRRHKVLFTQGNLNNHIGVPKTLLRLRPEHEMAVIETGANHPGEIGALADIVQPDCGLITNVGKAHLEGFGSFEGVVRTKSELYGYLRTHTAVSKQVETPFIFLHGDNPHLCETAQGLAAFTYGAPGKGYDVEGEAVEGSAFLTLRWRKKGTASYHEVPTQLIGNYNADNALAACAVGLRFDVSEADICAALREYRPTNNRSELKRTATNELIVDAYNANPTSMKAALDNFRTLRHPHKMAILGEMRELGEASAAEHRAVAERLSDLGCEEVWLVGENFRPYAGKYRYFATVADIKAYLTNHLLTEKLILIKGSNGTRLFELPESL